MSDNLDNLLNAMGGEMTEDELDAMLRELMEEDSANTWTPSSEAAAAVEAEPEEIAEIFEHLEEIIEVKIVEEAAPDEEELEEEKPKKNPLKAIGAATFGRLSAGMKEAKTHSKKLYKATMGLVAGVVLALIGVTVLFMIDRFGGGDDATFVASPGHNFNHAGHPFVNISTTLGDYTIHLSQVILDETATIFNIDGIWDLERFHFELEGAEGRIYNRDIVFAQNPARELLIGRTSLRFEPVDRDGTELTLTVTDSETGLTATKLMTYNYDSITPARFFYEAAEFENIPIPGLSVTLNHAQFSAAGSTIGLSIYHNFADGDIVFEEGDASPVSLRHRAVFAPPVTGILHTAEFDGGPTLARMDFGALQSLVGDVEIFLDGLYRLYEGDYIVPVSAIITPGAARIYELELSANHRITIRGMARQGPLFVMPLFGERLGIENERIATTLSVYLVGIDANGREQRIAGHVNFGDRGTDVLFDTNLNERINDIPVAELWVEIESVSIRLPGISHRLNLLRGSEEALNLHHDDLIAQLGGRGTNLQVASTAIRGGNLYAIIMEQDQNLLQHNVAARQRADGFWEINNVQTDVVER
ncbi:MAG: hypothetical protein LBE35_10820 [Clostridiales bacterium]|jgi:hypothetical protein|nr:hypothetical protein [Clostridiales bacterium]